MCMHDRDTDFCSEHEYVRRIFPKSSFPAIDAVDAEVNVMGSKAVSCKCELTWTFTENILDHKRLYVCQHGHRIPGNSYTATFDQIQATLTHYVTADNQLLRAGVHGGSTETASDKTISLLSGCLSRFE